MKIIPLRNQILVTPAAASKQTPSGLHIPDAVADDHRDRAAKQWRVVATGPGVRTPSGFIEPQVKVGDLVYTTRYCGTEFDHDGAKMALIREDEILVVVEAS